jgi:hypothetical protein
MSEPTKNKAAMATANNMKIIFDPHYRTARLTPPNVAANYASTWADHSAFCDGNSQGGVIQ